MQIQKQNNTLFGKDIKTRQWLIALFISLILIPIPIIVLFGHSRLLATEATSSVSGVGSIIGLFFAILVANYLKEKQKHNSFYATKFQKFSLTIFILVIISNALAITAIVKLPPVSPSEKLAYQLQKKFGSINYYYNGDLETSYTKLMEGLDHGDFKLSRQALELFDSVESKVINEYLKLCEEAATNNLDLPSYNVGELAVVCKNKNILLECKDETVETLRVMTSFFENFSNQNRESCLKLLNELQKSSECEKLDTELGTTDSSYIQEVENFCAQMK